MSLKKIFDIYSEVENKAPVVISITNYNNFVADIDFAEKIWSNFWPIEVPTIRSTGDKPMLFSSKQPKDLRSQRENYYNAVKELVDKRRLDCNSINIVLMDINIIKSRSDYDILIECSDFSHPLIVGELLFLFQLTGTLVAFKKLKNTSRLAEQMRMSNARNHIVRIGLSESVIKSGRANGFAGNQNLKSLIFSGIVAMAETAKKLNMISNLK